MTEQLKPCPFCGGESDADTLQGHRGDQRHFVSCRDENCVGFVADPYLTFATQREAIAAWNRRADDEAVRALAKAFVIRQEREPHMESNIFSDLRVGLVKWNGDMTGFVLTPLGVAALKIAEEGKDG